jgi:hypothetical protein
MGSSVLMISKEVIRRMAKQKASDEAQSRQVGTDGLLTKPSVLTLVKSPVL